MGRLDATLKRRVSVASVLAPNHMQTPVARWSLDVPVFAPLPEAHAHFVQDVVLVG